MGTRTVARDIAVDLCKKHPDVPSRTLARQLRRDEPKLFKDIEEARRMVREVRGASGNKRRKYADAPQPKRQAGEALPRGKSQAIKPVRIPSGKTLILNDLHIPYHNHEAIRRAVKHGLDEGCETLYLNGDVIDFYAVSRWQTDPRQRDLPNEINTTKKVLAHIGKDFRRRYYKAGNHDERWDKYIWQRAEELVGIEGFSLQEVLQLKYHGYEFVHGRQVAYMGKLPVIHGHEGRFSSPVNPARGLWNKLSEASLCGHLHRTSQHGHTRGLSKQNSSTWSVGCMCALIQDYDILAAWNLGFAIVTHDARSYQVENFQMDPKAKKIWRA